MYVFDFSVKNGIVFVLVRELLNYVTLIWY